MLVPMTKSTGTRNSRSTRSTPMWAKPRAPPPDSTSATLGRGLTAVSGRVCAGAREAHSIRPEQNIAARTCLIDMAGADCLTAKAWYRRRLHHRLGHFLRRAGWLVLLQ